MLEDKPEKPRSKIRDGLDKVLPSFNEWFPKAGEKDYKDTPANEIMKNLEETPAV